MKRLSKRQNLLGIYWIMLNNIYTNFSVICIAAYISVNSIKFQGILKPAYSAYSLTCWNFKCIHYPGNRT